MKMEGGCFCGTLRYQVEGRPLMKGQCHCRSCQHHSGGAPNLFLVMPKQGFSYTQGTPRQFRRDAADAMVTRDFCESCGTHVANHRDGLEAVIVKIGTLDDPARFGGPKVALYLAETQAFHHVPDGVHCFDGLPS